MTSYFDELPKAEREKLDALAWKYLRLSTIPDLETAIEVLAWQSLEIEVQDAHTAWLERTKAAVERSGREWTRENFLRFTRLHGVGE
jgi:hypothetical protein